MKESKIYCNNKLNLVNKFNLDAKTSTIIINFVNFLVKNTELNYQIIDHFFNSFIILINYDTENIKIIDKLLQILKKSTKLLLMELTEQLNNFSEYEYDDNYDNVIFETFDFLKYFYYDNNLPASINIIHEIIYNISRINKNVDKEVKSRLYIEILNDVLKNLKNKKSNKHIYLSTVETCNITIRLINDFIG
jgi:hypothetical protein